MRLLIGILLCAMGYVGCASAVDEPYFSCESDDDCPSGKRCVAIDFLDQICKSAECETSSDCEKGEYCDSKNQQCREYCENDWDCKSSEDCNEATGKCIETSNDN